jgi:hypothetical protein
MVELVYFGQEIADAVGGPVTCFRAEPVPHWVSLENLRLMLDGGETVNIRPATFAEFARVESHVALLRIGQDALSQLGRAAE